MRGAIKLSWRGVSLGDGEVPKPEELPATIESLNPRGARNLSLDSLRLLVLATQLQLIVLANVPGVDAMVGTLVREGKVTAKSVFSKVVWLPDDELMYNPATRKQAVEKGEVMRGGRG